MFYELVVSDKFSCKEDGSSAEHLQRRRTNQSRRFEIQFHTLSAGATRFPPKNIWSIDRTSNKHVQRRRRRRRLLCVPGVVVLAPVAGRVYRRVRHFHLPHRWSHHLRRAEGAQMVSLESPTAPCGWWRAGAPIIDFQETSRKTGERSGGGDRHVL